MLPPLARTYLLTALEGTPGTLEKLLSDLEADDERWDIGPELERYTLREIVAHLALVEPNWAQRTIRIRDEDQPFFPTVPRQDDAVALNAPANNLAYFKTHRFQFVALLRELKNEDWERGGLSEFLGPLTLEQLAVFVLAHDGYHTAQVTQWLAAME